MVYDSFMKGKSRVGSLALVTLTNSHGECSSVRPHGYVGMRIARCGNTLLPKLVQ